MNYLLDVAVLMRKEQRCTQAITGEHAVITRRSCRCPGKEFWNDVFPCSWKEFDVSLPQTTGGYGLGPGDGEALWFNGGLGVLKATGDQTEGRIAVMELSARKGFAAPLHVHRNEDEFFLVLSGEVRVQHGENVIEAVAGSFVHGPRGVPHSFHVDSAEARLLLFFGPAGVEGFFREGGKPARSLELPPTDEQFLDRQGLMEIAGRYQQEFVGPPLPPKD
jgi:quercetin dioxygenase-like cupin family protein